MKNLFKIFLFIFSLNFIACNEDDLNNKNESNIEKNQFKANKPIIVTHISHLKNTNVSKSFSKFLKEENSRYSSKYAFSIVDSLVQVAEYEDYTNYTFEAITDSIHENTLVNYIYTEYNDGAFKQHLVKYPYTIEDNSNVLFSENITLQTIEDDSLIDNSNLRGGGCPMYVDTEVSVGCTGGGHAEGDSKCKCGVSVNCTPGYTYTTTSVVWVSCGGGSGGPNSENTSGGGNNYGNGGGSETTNPFITTPTPIKYKYMQQLQDALIDNSDEIQLNSILYVLEKKRKFDTLNTLKDLIENNEIQLAKRLLEKLEKDINIELTPEYLNIIRIELNLIENPFFLIENCDQIEEWIDLSNHNAPQQVLDKLDGVNQFSLFEDWYIQELQNASGAVLNMDFFPITITQFPTNPSTNQPYTPEEFFNFFRLNLTTLANGSDSWVSFSPSMISGYAESEIWNSNSPLGAIISIYINEDSGSVICTDYDNNTSDNNQHWIFSTLNTPFGLGSDYDSAHPVSGNRKFGYYRDANNNYVYYTRGVDRFESGILEYLASDGIINIDNQEQFEGADNLWNTVISNIKNHVNSNGGQSQINTIEIYRPNWNDVKDVILGDKPLSHLGC